MFSDNIDRLLMQEKMAVKKVVTEFIKNMITKDTKCIGLSKGSCSGLRKE